MARRGEVLIGIVNDPRDLAIAREQHWYRIPVGSARKWIGKRWPPQWLAFYQTKVFGDEAYAVRYYARVRDIRKASRKELLPDEPPDGKKGRSYYQLLLSPLETLPRPIVSLRHRRIVFIPTTWRKFVTAEQINDLYDDSPLEDRLWDEFKQVRIDAERQAFIRVEDREYCLDFAIYCEGGNLDVETDGDSWHGRKERIPLDNLRDNDLETVGWNLLRFNGMQIREQMAEYCLPVIGKKINKLGGLKRAGRALPRQVELGKGETRQLDMFDDSDP
jgi:very-short-patch-repair endonuclease